MLELRRKSANAITIMATSVAMIVSMKNCHERATTQPAILVGVDSSKWKNKRDYPNPYPNQFHNSNNTHYLVFPTNHGQSKPISSKMAYALLQELKKANPKQKVEILEKFHTSETQLLQQLNPIAQEKKGRKFVNENFPISTFNPNDLDSQTWVNQLNLKPWKLKFINRYRNRLGGFCSLSQLHEIPQLDSQWMATTFKTIEEANKVNRHFPVLKLNKNSSWKQWYQHPYVGAEIAKILQPFYAARTCVRLKELQAIKEIPAPQLQLLLPYLSIDCKD